MASRTRFPDCPWYLALPCFAAGLALLCCAFLHALGLGLGSLGARGFVGLLLLLAAALAAALLRRSGCPARTVLALLLPVGLALFLRALALDAQTQDYRDFLSQWAAFFRDNGGFAAIREPLGDYNVPYLYFLAAISYLPVPDLYLIKLLSVACDVLLAWSGLRLTRRLCRAGSPAPLACFCALLLLPTAVLNGAYWGQCDSLYTFLLLLALDAALGRRPIVSAALLAAAFSFKLQAVFLLPLWCALWFGGRVKFRHLLCFPAAYAAILLPALLLGKPLGDILGVYFRQMEEYNSRLTLNAPSLFALLPYGYEADVALLSRVGIALAFALVLAVLLALFPRRRGLTDEMLAAAALVLAIGTPFLLPHMHERYFYPAGALAVVWACARLRRLPAALAAELSSLSSYNPYLNLRYTRPVRAFGQTFAMGLEALLMLFALGWSAAALARLLRAPPSPPANAR